MRYCRIAIDTDTRGRVYQKDFEVQHVFGSLARAQAVALVNQGIVPEGAHFRAVVFPRYGDTLVTAALVQENTARAEEPRSEWIELETDGPAASPQPLRFFTLELRFPELKLVYSRDFQITGLDSFWANLQHVMLTMNILADGDVYYPRIFAREDDAADFDREWASPRPADDGRQLVELIVDEAPLPEFPHADLRDFEPLRVERPAVISPVELAALDMAQQDDVQIVICEPTLRALQAIAAQDVQIEQGGMLVGTVYCQRSDPARYLVVVTDSIPAEGTTANLVELRYTFESWQRGAALLRERFPGKRIVGWYHTHLITVEMVGEDGETQTSELFFSQDDRFMHRRFFSDPWYVAMVLGTEGNAGFFRWFGGKISANRCYYVSAGACESYGG